MSIVCLNDQLRGVSNELCDAADPITILSGVVFALPSQFFSTYVKFATKSDWLTDIASNLLFPAQGVKEIEDISTEDSVTTTGTGDMVFNHEGKTGKRLSFAVTLEMHEVIREYGFKNLLMYKLDRNNNIIGVSDDGTTVRGFKLSYLRVLRYKEPLPGSPGYTIIEYQEANNSEMNKYAKYVNPTWLNSDLQGVLKVGVAPSTMAANVFTAVVAYNNSAKLTSAGVADSAAISGLVAANFQLTDQTGAILNPATAYTVTESTTKAGTYTIDATVGAMTSGSVKIVASSANLYRSDSTTVTAAP